VRAGIIHGDRPTSDIPGGRRRIDFSRYVVVPLWYGCNNDCTICMLSSVQERLPGVPFDVFRRLVTDVVNDGRRPNLILSGGEVTTFPHLDRYVEFASTFSWFSRIQIQTNGRLLADDSYLHRLIDAGVNEFFVSLHGPAAVHDRISRRPGSFDEVMAGLKNLSAYQGINVITNTVLTRENSRHLRSLFGQIAQLSAVGEFHLWNFFPMATADTMNQIESLAVLKQVLPAALEPVASSGKPVVLKAFPQCLDVAPPACVDNEFPITIIPDLFWQTLKESGFGACVHRARCRDRKCWGLSRAYRDRYGDESEMLRPF
jgi:sulfatase maturation enzyme AslB (radical SAM superfamily)